MLVFAPPLSLTDGLDEAAGSGPSWHPPRDGFRDNDEVDRVYRLPSRLVPVAQTDGQPGVLIATDGDGGVASLALDAAWPALPAGHRRVPFAALRYRLVASGAARHTGEWRDGFIQGDRLVDRRLQLGPVEAALMRHLLERNESTGVLDLELEYTLRGQTAPLPWQVRLQADRLYPRLLASLGQDVHPWPAVEAAFLALEREAFDWSPQQAGVLPPRLDEALPAIAFAASPTWLERADGGWRLHPEPPPVMDLDLGRPRLQQRRYALHWSLSDFIRQQSDPSRFIRQLEVPAPFQAAELLVSNELPLTEEGIRQVDIEFSSGGPSGRLHHVFRIGEPSAVRLPFVRESSEPLSLTARIKAVVDTARGPALVRAEQRGDQLRWAIDAKGLKLALLRLELDSELLGPVSAFAVTVGQRRVLLDGDRPERWLVGRNLPSSVRVEALAPDGDSRSFGELPVSDGRLRLDAASLGLEPVRRMRLRAAADQSAQRAYLAIQSRDGAWRSLADDELELVWTLSHPLAPLRFEYRTRHVSRDAAGQTRPMATSDWQLSEADTIEVRI